LAQNITTGIKQLCDDAFTRIKSVSAEDAIAMLDRDDVTFVDIRDIRELKREGRVPGAFHCPRGMLEFWIDPNSPYHKEAFAAENTFVVFCAGGLRSALATDIAQKMGLSPVINLTDGFGAWRNAGGPIETE
jgi:rhodanese-related sulfurtransferase